MTKVKENTNVIVSSNKIAPIAFKRRLAKRIVSLSLGVAFLCLCACAYILFDPSNRRLISYHDVASNSSRTVSSRYEIHPASIDFNSSGLSKLEASNLKTLQSIAKVHGRFTSLNDFTILLIPINHGFLDFGLNLLCSLRKINPILVNHVIFWALDDKVRDALAAYRNSSLEVADDNKDVVALSTFGIFYSVGDTYSSEFESGGTGNYWKMMSGRPRLFVSILDRLKIGLFFVDADIVFLRYRSFKLKL